MSPVVAGLGAATVTGLAAGFGGAKAMNGFAEKHPTGSDADKPARRVQWGMAGAGVVSGFAGMAAMWSGRPTLGAALFGAGAGAMLGSFGAGIAFSRKHGIGVETSVQDALNGYDHNRNGQLDLQDSFWRQSEMVRTVTTRHEDADGDVHYDTDTYTIDRLALRADADQDWVVTRGELTDTIGRYDADENGRLQGDEAKRFERELGERWIG